MCCGVVFNWAVDVEYEPCIIGNNDVSTLFWDYWHWNLDVRASLRLLTCHPDAGLGGVLPILSQTVLNQLCFGRVRTQLSLLLQEKIVTIFQCIFSSAFKFVLDERPFLLATAPEDCFQ